MLKSKTTWLLVVMILVVALIGGLEQKNTTVNVNENGSKVVDLNK